MKRIRNACSGHSTARSNRRRDLKNWLWLAIILCFPIHYLQAGNVDATAWAQKGSAALAAGDYPTAVSLFQKALASDPSEVSYLVDLSKALIQSGQFGDGQQALETGLSNFSDPAKQLQLWAALADLHIAWARNFKRSYSFEEAIRQYLAALEIDKVRRPQLAGGDLNSIGVTYKQGGAFEQANSIF